MIHSRTVLSEPLARPGDRPVPGYCLVTRRGRGGFGEVWEAEAAGGFRVALKIVRLPVEARSAEVSALTVVRGIRHPNLLVSFGAWQEDGMLIVGMELADRSLWDRFIEAEDQGLRGIPRGELLGYLWDVASGIDHLNEPRHTLEGRPGVGVQHRDLKPQNILLFGGGAKVADFGEAQVMDGPVAPNNGTWTLAYAAPEFFDGFTTHRSDQYALAVTYCQLRGGQLPYLGTDVTVTAGHLLGTPDLEGLPEPERPILARALAKRPEDRWPSCTAMIEALRMLGMANNLPIPETLYGPPSRDQDFQLRRTPDTGELSGTTSPLDANTLWDEDDGHEDESGEDFELASIDHYDLFSTNSGASASWSGPAAVPSPSAKAAPAVLMPRGGSSPRVMVTRAAVALVTAGLLLAATEARTSAGRLRRISVTTRPEVSRPRPGQAKPAPGPANLDHEERRSPLAVASTVAKVPRPPTIVTSTIEGDREAGPTGSERPAPALEIKPAQSAQEIAAGPPPLIDDPTPPGAEEVTVAADPLPDPLPVPSGSPILAAPDVADPGPPRPQPGTPTLDLPGDAPDVADRGLPRPQPATPTLELPSEVRVRAGETAKVRVRVDREGGSGPAVLRFSGMSRGVSVDGPAIPADAKETEVVVSAVPDALPVVAEIGVSAEVGDRRAEARVRLTVLPSASSEAYTRGRVLLTRGEQARAGAEFSKAIELDPRNALAYLFRAAAASMEGRPRDALTDYTEAIRLKPDNDRAYGFRGRIWLQTGDVDRALADYTEAIRLNPDNAITHAARGRIHADRGQYDRALADYSEVIRLKPKSAEASYWRGQIRYYSGDNAGAVVDFSEAIRLDPDYAWAYRNRGDAFARLGNRACADADHAMVERLAHPVQHGKTLKLSAPPAVEPEAGARVGASPSGLGPRQPPRRTTASNLSSSP